MAATAQAAPAGTNNSPFIRSLASSSRVARERALASLRSYLTTHKNFSEMDFLKLQKGLFYCLYMQDKVRNQQRLAMEMAGLMESFYTAGMLRRRKQRAEEEAEKDVDEEAGENEDGEEDSAQAQNFISWNRAFFSTISSQWEGIDKHRMDKFLFLIRQYVKAAFAYLQATAWKESLIKDYCDILEATPLHPREARISNGLRLHILDVYLDELEKVDEERKAPVENLLAPVRRIAREGMAKNVRSRAKEVLEDERLAEWNAKEISGAINGGLKASSTTADGGEDEDEEWGGIDD